MSLNTPTHQQLKKLSPTALRVILAIVIMLENGEQEAVDKFMAAMERAS